MIKRLLLFVALLLILSYLILAVTILNRPPAGQLCRELELVIKDTAQVGFVTKSEVRALLEKRDIYPVGKRMEQVHTKTLERALSSHPLIDRTECYKTPSGKLCIEVHQRLPILRVMNEKGEDYYIDSKGAVMPAEAKCVANRVIATGNVEKSFAMRDLYKFGVFLQNNPFWDAQIEQIHVLPNGGVELVPRVGNHIIYLGKLENTAEKLERLKIFYEKALNQVGWNKYARISLEFGNQIICTKWEEQE